MVAGDNLDITATSSQSSEGSEVAHIPAAEEDSTKSKIPGLAASSSADEGLSAAQKLMFFGGIVAVCALFLRSRSGKSNTGTGSFKEKSMA